MLRSVYVLQRSDTVGVVLKSDIKLIVVGKADKLAALPCKIVTTDLDGIAEGNSMLCYELPPILLCIYLQNYVKSSTLLSQLYISFKYLSRRQSFRKILSITSRDTLKGLYFFCI